MPDHVAVIMDGNGRHARADGLPRPIGHERGASVAKEIVKEAGEIGVSVLTLYVFSTENWNRPEEEVERIMGLLRSFAETEVGELIDSGISVRVIGDRNRLDINVRIALELLEQATAHCTNMILQIAVSYGGRDELVRAFNALRATTQGDVVEGDISAALDTAGIPDPDLLIRTGGEQRISNFMLWQCAYAELVFTETLWPDFTRGEFREICTRFGKRERRFGEVAAAAE